MADKETSQLDILSPLKEQEEKLPMPFRAEPYIATDEECAAWGREYSLPKPWSGEGIIDRIRNKKFKRAGMKVFSALAEHPDERVAIKVAKSGWFLGVSYKSPEEKQLGELIFNRAEKLREARGELWNPLYDIVAERALQMWPAPSGLKETEDKKLVFQRGEGPRAHIMRHISPLLEQETEPGNWVGLLEFENSFLQKELLRTKKELTDKFVHGVFKIKPLLLRDLFSSYHVKPREGEIRDRLIERAISELENASREDKLDYVSYREVVRLFPYGQKDKMAETVKRLLLVAGEYEQTTRGRIAKACIPSVYTAEHSLTSEELIQLATIYEKDKDFLERLVYSNDENLDLLKFVLANSRYTTLKNYILKKAGESKEVREKAQGTKARKLLVTLMRNSQGEEFLGYLLEYAKKAPRKAWEQWTHRCLGPNQDIEEKNKKGKVSREIWELLVEKEAEKALDTFRGAEDLIEDFDRSDEWEKLLYRALKSRNAERVSEVLNTSALFSEGVVAKVQQKHLKPLLKTREENHGNVALRLIRFPAAIKDEEIRAFLIKNIGTYGLDKVVEFMTTEDLTLLLDENSNTKHARSQMHTFFKKHLDTLSPRMTQEQLSELLKQEDRELRIQVISILGERAPVEKNGARKRKRN